LGKGKTGREGLVMVNHADTPEKKLPNSGGKVWGVGFGPGPCAGKNIPKAATKERGRTGEDKKFN